MDTWPGSAMTTVHVRQISLRSNATSLTNATDRWRGDYPKDDENNNVKGFAFNDTFMSREEIQRLLGEHYQSMVPVSNFSASTQVVLIVAFALLIIFGAAGNGLVCYVVAKNPHMRTPRNIFIINLAISDLTLCLFTQPFNLMKVSMSVWHLGDFMCKFVPMFSGTNVFVSTISITAIALDRFQVIVYPTKGNMKNYGTVVALVSIWVISLLMASPLLIFNVTHGVEPYPGIILYRVCVENPGLHYEKGAYSIASMIFQYLVPIAIVSVAHARICNKLKYRMVNQRPAVVVTTVFQNRRNVREAKRKRRTNMLLIGIGVVFACSWMPLNVFNILADFDQELLKLMDKDGMTFAICHLLVLGSACTNPVLYGWLNENFRREFVNIFCASRGGRHAVQSDGKQARRRVNVDDETPTTTNSCNGRTGRALETTECLEIPDNMELKSSTQALNFCHDNVSTDTKLVDCR